MNELLDSLIELCADQALALMDLSEHVNALERVLTKSDSRLSASLVKEIQREKRKNTERAAQVRTTLVKLRDRASRIVN